MNPAYFDEKFDMGIHAEEEKGNMTELQPAWE